MSDGELGEELVRLASADNFRDVTGPDAAYVGADGRPLRRGVAFRSNELQLTAADAESLARLGITAVYDLRSDHEVELHPDVAVPGATWTQLEVKGIPMDAVTDLHDRATAHDVMLRVYRGFVEVEGAREAFATLFREIADGSGAALFHCTAGKDRTGWAAALLLHLAGVDDATILEDYLLTNSFSSATREKYLGLVREHLGADKVDVYERVMVADEAYLRAGYHAVTATYGDRLGYLRDGLGLDDATVDTAPRQTASHDRGAPALRVARGRRRRRGAGRGPAARWRRSTDRAATSSTSSRPAQRLAWGYPDQPSFTPFLARLATEIAPHHLVVLRLPALLGVVGDRVAGGAVLPAARCAPAAARC